jgi:hypothetical protein
MSSNHLNRPARRLWLAMGLTMLLVGCADLPAPRIGQLPDRVELTAVPFYRGADDQGAPTALAGLLRDRGVAVTPGLVSPYLKLPAQPSALDANMEEAARQYGLIVYPLEPDFQGLLTQVAAGNPVLLRYREGNSLWGMQRYAVLIGYDRFKSHVVLRAGEQRRALMPFNDFISAWQAAGNWAVLVQPATRLPAQVNADRWRAAASRLGQAGQEGAAAKALGALQIAQ